MIYDKYYLLVFHNLVWNYELLLFHKVNNILEKEEELIGNMLCYNILKKMLDFTSLLKRYGVLHIPYLFLFYSNSRKQAKMMTLKRKSLCLSFFLPHLEQIIEHIANTVYSILLCDHSLKVSLFNALFDNIVTSNSNSNLLLSLMISWIMLFFRNLLRPAGMQLRKGMFIVKIYNAEDIPQSKLTL